MLIAIDYDETWSRDPEFWRAFEELARTHGHEVIGVTGRDERETDDMCPHYFRLQRFHTGGKAKRSFVESRLGRPVSVWIDDSPEFIGRGFGDGLWP